MGSAPLAPSCTTRLAASLLVGTALRLPRSIVAGLFAVALGAALFDDLEDKAARDLIGLGEAYGDRIAQAVDPPGAAADQAMLGLLVVVVIAGQAADRHQPIGTALLEGHEEPEPRHAIDAAGKGRTDPRREIGGGGTVDGAALGGGGAPLGLRDVLADRGKGGEGHLGTFALAEILARRVVPADQGAVNEQVGITPDRRGEMRVAPERKAEMADILGAVERLRLAAQDELVDHRGVGRAGSLLQQPVEVARSHRLPLGEAQADALQPLEKLAQGLELGRARRIWDAGHAGMVEFFQRPGG